MNNKNLPIIVGIALPVVFVIIISFILFVPSLSISPKYNFLYTYQNDYYAYSPYYYANTYKVENSHVVLSPVIPVGDDNRSFKETMPALYLYDVKNNTSREISFEEARQLSLDAGPSSPDGYSVEYRYGNDGIFEIFGSTNDNNGIYIQKGRGQKRLQGISGDGRYYYYGNFDLIGWIK